MFSLLRPVVLLSLALGAVSTPVANSLGSSRDDPAHQVGSHQLLARGSCKDNLGRCFNPTGTKPNDMASRAAATAFCSSFMSIPVVTTTISTTTPVTVVTVTETVVAATEVVTSVTTSDVEATETTQTTSTTYVSVAPVKRAVSSAALPNCATGAARSPEAYSSACSCVGATASTTYVTGTAPVATNTATDYTSITTTTVTVTTATVTTGTVTEVETSVATLTSSPPAPLCLGASNPYYNEGHYYTLYCDQYYYDYANVIGEFNNVANFSDCIQFCSDTPECVYSYWVSSTSSYGDRLYCYTFRAFDPSRLYPAHGVDTFALRS